MPTWGRMRRALPYIGAALLVLLLVVGLKQAGGNKDEGGGTTAGEKTRDFDLARAQRRLRGAPAPLAALHEQSSDIIAGGRPAFEKRLLALRGHPVVVNKWASWCGPCRAEFPILQSLSTQQGRRVAFVGLDSKDKRGAAAAFLQKYPVPYPSYEDEDEDIARSLNAPANFPITVFIDAKGRTRFVHPGGYRSAADLSADIDRYLGA
jgi:cytochrome c biogenesis protein CcmG/thiol:disulfide interchange protein DsbE